MHKPNEKDSEMYDEVQKWKNTNKFITLKIRSHIASKAAEIRRQNVAPPRFHYLQGTTDIPENNEADKWASLGAIDAWNCQRTHHSPLDCWSGCKLYKFVSFFNPVENRWCRQEPAQAIQLWFPP